MPTLTNDRLETFDVTEARKQFPALSTPQVYFDNAGGSQVLKPVIDSYDLPLIHYLGWCWRSEV